MRIVLTALLIGALASAPLTVTACGGCGIDELDATVSPKTTCLDVTALRGWGCDDTAALEGKNTCPSAVTISKTGTALAADLVVPPGAEFDIDVLRDPGVGGAIPQKSFAITIDGRSGTIDVAW